MKKIISFDNLNKIDELNESIKNIRLKVHGLKWLIINKGENDKSIGFSNLEDT